jgi:peptidylprolyl isomerase
MLRSVTLFATNDWRARPWFSLAPADRYPCRPVGTDKRERQKSARFLKIEAEQQAAKRARTRRTVIRLVIAVVVVLGGTFVYSTVWGGDDGGADTETATDESTTTLPATTTTTYSNPELAAEVLGRTPPDPAPPPTDTAADALEITSPIAGEGEAVAAGDTVVAHYVGKLADGTVFDSSWEIGQPITVPVGQGQVIPGWDEGLIGVTIGERRRLVIGSDKAYGPEGQPDGGIAPNAPLAFEIDVVDVIKAG